MLNGVDATKTDGVYFCERVLFHSVSYEHDCRIKFLKKMSKFLVFFCFLSAKFTHLSEDKEKFM